MIHHNFDDQYMFQWIIINQGLQFHCKEASQNNKGTKSTCYTSLIFTILVLRLKRRRGKNYFPQFHSRNEENLTLRTRTESHLTLSSVWTSSLQTVQWVDSLRDGHCRQGFLEINAILLQFLKYHFFPYRIPIFMPISRFNRFLEWNGFDNLNVDLFKTSQPLWKAQSTWDWF